MGGKGSGPRKYFYTPEVHAEIIRNLKLGAHRKHAAEAARIAYDAFREWCELGAQGVEPYVQFAADVEQAVGEDAVRNQGIITKAAAGEHRGDWKAAAWNLEKKHPLIYGSTASIVEGLARAETAARKKAERAARDPKLDDERPHSPWLARDDAHAGKKGRLDA